MPRISSPPDSRPRPVDIHVGNLLRALRLAGGMSQVVLARQLGISFQQVQKYEKGANRIGASRLWELCRIFNVPPGYFFAGIDAERVPDGLGSVLDSRSLVVALGFSRIERAPVREAISKLVVALTPDEPSLP